MTDYVTPITDQTITSSLSRKLTSMNGQLLADCVFTGFTVSVGTGSTVNIAAGKAHASGVYFERDAVTNSVAVVNGTNHIWVTIDELNTAGAVLFTVNTSGTPPATPCVKLATCVVTAGTPATPTDVRNLDWFGSDPKFGTKFLEMAEQSAPASPSADRIRVYAKDDSGTTKLAYKDSSGTETTVGSGGLAVATVTSSTTMASNTMYRANPTGGAFTLTLPAAPALGDRVIVTELVSGGSANLVTIAPNTGQFFGKPEGGTSSNPFKTLIPMATAHVRVGLVIEFVYIASLVWQTIIHQGSCSGG